MSEAVHIRRAGHDDVVTLVRFNQAMALESENRHLEQSVLERGVAHLLDHDSEGLYLLAEVGAEPAGALMLTFEWSDWRAGRFWWIQSVYVAPEWRRRGVYRALHERVRGIARDDPLACGLRLYVEKDNTGAQATYHALGMFTTDYQLFEETF